MQDNTYDLEREIIEEENDHEIGDYNNSNPRPFTTDQGPNGKRPKVKTNNFYGFPSAGAFPIVYPNTRPFSEKLSKPSGRPMAQNTSFKSHDRSSHINPKDLELEQTNRNLQSPKKYLAVPVSGSQKNYKIIPKNIPQDKERLYDETLNLKNLVHSLKDENLRLKTKVNIMEKEALKFERMMADQDGGALERELVPKPSEGHLVVGLKNRLIEVENALQEKETELAKLKKNVRVTKMAELEAQLKLFTEESYRLKGVLDQLLKEKSQNMMRQEGRNRLQEECLLQAAQIKAMEKDHEQLVKIVKAFEQQSADYEKKLTEAKKEKKIETQKLKKLVAEKEKENMKLKQELETANSNLSSGPTYAGKRPFGNREEFSILELEKKKSENLNLLEQLNEKNTQIQQLEKKLKEATKLSLSPEKATGSRRPSNKLNIPVESLHQPLVKAPTQSEKEKRTDAVFILQDEDDMSEEEGSVADHEESGRVISVPRKRVQKVSADDVKELGYEINLSLRAKGKSFDDVNKVIWPESAVQRDRISVKEVIQILRRDPISMKNEEDAILIARYLVEENQAEYLYYNEDVEGDLVIAKSILRKLIGSVPNWSQQTLQSLHDSVSEICTKHHLSLRENLRVSCKDGNLNKKALKEVCKLIEVAVSDDQIEFIITKLFEKSHNVHALAIENLFEIFFRPPKESDLSRNGSMQEQTVPVPPVARKSVDLVSEFKPKKELVIPEPKNQEVHNYTTESPLKIKTPSQGTASQNDVKENKSRVSEEARVLAEVKQPSSRGQKSSARDESRSYEDDAQAEQNRKEAEPNQSEQREEEYQFEEEERSQGEQEYEQEQEEEQEEEEERHNEEQAQESGRAESIEMPESRRLESMVTNHTNTTQFTEPKSDILGVTNRAQEERKDEASERLNSISEKDENVESRREQTAGERKVTKEQEDEEEKEYKEEFQEEVEEEEAQKEEKTVSHRKEEKPEKAESGDEYENEEAFEEIDDDS